MSDAIEDAIRVVEENDHLRARVAELEAERSAAYQRGAESMRERAEASAKELTAALATYKHHFMSRTILVGLIEMLEAQIRALPLDEDAREDAQGGDDA